MKGAVLALLGALAFAVAAFWALAWVGARRLLQIGGAIELSPERAPIPHATTLELAHLAGIARPRLYVLPACHPPGAAIRDEPAGAIVIAEPVFGAFTANELRGLLALLVAALALPTPGRWPPKPERWFEIDRRAAKLTDGPVVAAALKAVARYTDDVVGTSSFTSFRSRLWRRVTAANGGVAHVLSEKPTMSTRLEALARAGAGAEEARVAGKDRFV